MSGASIRLSVDLLGSRRPGDSFGALVLRMADLTPVMDVIGSSMQDSVARRFGSEIGPGDKPWKRSKRAVEKGGKTLVDQGYLRDSVTWKTGPGYVEIGTNRLYAGIHQFGGKAGRGHSLELPARPFLGIDDVDEVKIEEIVKDFLSRRSP